MVKFIKAFSLVEVVVSIVIIAITSVTVPVIISITSKLNEKAIMQEVLLNAKIFLKVVTSSAYTCEYIAQNEYSPLPRFAYYGTGGNGDRNARFDYNFFEGNATDKPYNFYTKYSLNDTNRRTFVGVKNPNRNGKCSPLSNDTPLFCLTSADLGKTDGKNRCLEDFQAAYSSGINMTYPADVERDFIAPYQFSGLTIKRERNPFRTTQNKTEPGFELKHVLIDMRKPVTMRLITFVSNIGDSPVIQTKIWQ